MEAKVIEWNTNMNTAPKDGFYVFIKWPWLMKRGGVLACFHDGAWRLRPSGLPLPEPTIWRHRPQGATGGSI